MKTRETVSRLLKLNWRYDQASRRLFSAVDAGDTQLAMQLDHQVIDPIFGQLEYGIHLQARAALADALEHSARLRDQQESAAQAIAVAFGVGLALLGCFAFILLRFRRQELSRRLARRSPSPTRSPACATTAPSRRTWRASSSASGAPASRSRSSCSTSTG